MGTVVDTIVVPFKSHVFHPGTTLLLAIHDEANDMFWVANVGDSRGVLRSSGPEEVLPLSYDHKPNQVSQCFVLQIRDGSINQILAGSDWSLI